MNISRLVILMPTLDQRVAALERSVHQGRDEHHSIAERLDTLAGEVGKLEVFLSNGDGGLTVPVKRRTIKFAGSISLPWLMGILGGGGGAGWTIGRLTGAW